MDGFKADFIQYLRDNNLLERVDLNKNDTNILFDNNIIFTNDK